MKKSPPPSAYWNYHARQTRQGLAPPSQPTLQKSPTFKEPLVISEGRSEGRSLGAREEKIWAGGEKRGLRPWEKELGSWQAVKDPDLAALRMIFPDTSDLFHGALFAHLIAYRYVSSILPATIPKGASGDDNMLCMEPHPSDANTKSAGSHHRKTRSLARAGRVSSGLAQGLDISEMGDGQQMEALRDGLRECAGRLMDCMAGRRMGLLDGSYGSGNRPSNVGDGELFRALVEIVGLGEG